MNSLIYLMLVTFGCCAAHYGGGYDTRNYIVREEPVPDVDGEIIECPVCGDSEHWMASIEECPIAKGNKTYKKCRLGTYVNEVCGNRLDCYRGPGEQCTVKREFDMFGKKCGPGYYCNKALGVCTGLGYAGDSHAQWQLTRFPYTWRRADIKPLPDSFAPIRN